MSFNTLKLYEALEQAKGEPRQMARAIADFVMVDAALTTKADLRQRSPRCEPI
jgi:hypothetical protein